MSGCLIVRCLNVRCLNVRCLVVWLPGPTYTSSSWSSHVKLVIILRHPDFGDTESKSTQRTTLYLFNTTVCAPGYNYWNDEGRTLGLIDGGPYWVDTTAICSLLLALNDHKQQRATEIQRNFKDPHYIIGSPGVFSYKVHR